MKLERFKLNENQIPEFQKVELIENISENWNQRLEDEYVTPRALFKFTIPQLLDIQNKFLYETVEEKPIMDDEIVSIYTGKEDEEQESEMEKEPVDIKEPKTFKEVEDLPTRTHEEDILDELREKYLDHEAVENIRLEHSEEGDYFIFDVKCETQVQSMNEYAGYKLVFNHLCNIEDHVNEDIINERWTMMKESLINDFINQIKKSE